MAYTTVARTFNRTEVVKGSRFIALVCNVDSSEEVIAQLTAQRALYPDASHHCYAYRLGAEMRFSDDGEPGGTAGRPMLEVLLKRELDYTLAVVTRYFGGTRLGAGGLVRAYSGSLAKALDEAGQKRVKDYAQLEFDVAFEHMDAVHRMLDDWHDLRKDKLDYTVQGMRLTVILLEADEARFVKALTELSRGTVQWRTAAS